MIDYIEEQLNKGYTDHLMLLGVEGSGKTHATKIEIHKELKKGRKVFLLDFRNLYKEFKQYDFTNHILLDTTETICLFEFVPDIDFSSEEESKMYPYEYYLFCRDKMVSLLNLFNRTLTHEENNVILNTIVTLYESIGITQQQYEPQVEFPNLNDFLCLLEKENHHLYQEIAHFSSFFSARKTHLPFTEELDYISLNVDAFVKGEKELLLHTILLIFNQHIRRNSKRSVIVIDSLETFAITEHIATRLVLMMKVTGKKYGVKCIFTHCSLTKLLKQCGEGVLVNCNAFAFFKQAEMEREQLIASVAFYEEQINELTQFQKGRAIVIYASIVVELLIPKKFVGYKNTEVDTHNEQD